jgi:hypothetical protein
MLRSHAKRVSLTLSTSAKPIDVSNNACSLIAAQVTHRIAPRHSIAPSQVHALCIAYSEHHGRSTVSCGVQARTPPRFDYTHTTVGDRKHRRDRSDNVSSHCLACRRGARLLRLIVSYLYLYLRCVIH